MRRRSWVVVSLTAIVLLVVASGAAATTASSNARSTGDGFVQRLRQTRACETATKHGFFAGGGSYLAACASKDGSFRFIAVVQAKPRGLTARSGYIQGQIDDVCKQDGGVVLTAGVAKQYFAMYLGQGDGADVANGLWQGLTEQLDTADGYFARAEKCDHGIITPIAPPSSTVPAG